MHEEVKPLTLNIEFEKKEPVLDYYTILYQNGTDGKDLSKGARYRNKENYVIFDVKVTFLLSYDVFYIYNMNSL